MSILWLKSAPWRRPLVLGGSATINAGDRRDERIFTAIDADRFDFLNSTGIYANTAATA